MLFRPVYTPEELKAVEVSGTQLYARGGRYASRTGSTWESFNVRRQVRLWTGQTMQASAMQDVIMRIQAPRALMTVQMDIRRRFGLHRQSNFPRVEHVSRGVPQGKICPG